MNVSIATPTSAPIVPNMTKNTIGCRNGARNLRIARRNFFCGVSRLISCFDTETYNLNQFS